MKRSRSWLLMALMPWLIGCATRDGFQCGTPLPSDSDVIRRCSEPHEICVCATLSCAARVRPSEDVDAGGCASGYRYVKVPYAARDIAEGCVPKVDLGSDKIIPNTERYGLCEVSDAAFHADAGLDSGSEPDADSGFPSDADSGKEVESGTEDAAEDALEAAAGETESDA